MPSLTHSLKSMGLRKELFQKKYILTIAKPEKVTIFAFPIKGIRTGAVVQSVRISACHAGGREFESRPHRREPLTQVRGSFFLRCRDSASSGKTRGNPLLRALILDFKPRLANRRSQKVKTRAIHAAHLQHAFHHALTMRLALDV